MLYRGFTLPNDIPLFFLTIRRVEHYRRLLRYLSLEEILQKPKEYSLKFKNDIKNGDQELLKKISKIATWYNKIVLKDKKPCFVRCLIIYEQALKMNLNASIVVGFNKTNNVKGYSWVSIDDKVFGENEKDLRPYTVITTKFNPEIIKKQF